MNAPADFNHAASISSDQSKADQASSESQSQSGEAVSSSVNATPSQPAEILATDSLVESKNHDILETHVVRENKTEEFLAHYGSDGPRATEYRENIRLLNEEIADLSGTLSGSSRWRLGWLKLTRQIPNDPERDLNLLESYREMFRARLEEDRRQTSAQRKPNAPAVRQKQTMLEAPVTGPRMTADQATMRLQYLEEHRATPAAEAHLRPGGRTEQYVHENHAAVHESEISVLKAFLRTQLHEPQREPEPERPTLDDDPENDLELCL